jgi:hypothetical protein
MAVRSEFHVLADEDGDPGPHIKAALFCFAVAGSALLIGYFTLGWAGLTDKASPDFAPVPHFIAAVGVLLGGFFLVRGYLDASRHRLFGASEVRGATPELGGALEGIFKVANTRLLKAPIELSLRCDWRGHSAGIHGGSGSDGTTTLWRQSQSVAINLAQSGVAFHFDLPADGLPTGRRPRPKTGVHPAGSGYIVWTLRAFSRRLGVNYLAEFEIPVRPGTVIRAVGAKTKPEPANHAAGALAQGVALVLGGSAPSQDELDDEAEARSRPEPDVPFASSRMPLQQGDGMVDRIALVVAVALSAIALYVIGYEITFTVGARDTPAVLADTGKSWVALNLGPDDPNHRITVSSFHNWAKGQSVTALCKSAVDGRARCHMQTGSDRWLNSVFAVVVAGLALAAWRWKPWRLRRSALT